jgi:hypothetical protein
MKIIITIFLILLSQLAFAQTIVKSSIDNGGESVSASGINIVYTLGEVNVQEYSTENSRISEGFISPGLFFSPLIIPGETITLLNSLGEGLAGGTVKYYASGWQTVEGETDNQGEIFVSLPEDMDPTSWKMYYAGASQQKNNPAKPIVFQTVNVSMELLSSNLEVLESENAKYYAGGWKIFGTGNTPANMELLPNNYPFKVYYKGGSKQLSQDVSVDPIVTFETVEAFMHLLSSLGDSLESDNAKYYASGWKTFGSGFTSTSMELLPNNYPFKVYYKGGSRQQSQDIGLDPNITFETLEASMHLVSSKGDSLESDNAEYYASGWKTFGSGFTSTSMELLPNNYPFKVYYKGGSRQQSQDIGLDPNITFETLEASMHLVSSKGDSLDSDNAEYYASGWKTFGSGNTSTSMELLPNNYPFKVYYKGGTNQLSQDISDNTDVVFSTGSVRMELYSSAGEPLESDDAKYYASGWKTFGTGNTPTSMELLPNSYPFKVYYMGGTNQENQVVTDGSIVEFYTTEVTMTLTVDGTSENSTDARYYAGGWKTFGTGVTETTMELLPNNYPFKVYFDGSSMQQSQDVGLDPIVAFNISNSVMKSAGSEQPSVIGMQVYPNPAKDWTTIGIQAEDGEKIMLYIYNAAGKLIYVAHAAGQLQEELDVSGYKPGLYLIMATVNEKRLLKHLIIH